ncbi:MAG TPA: hypothetical protein VF759_12175 [Allosphingosinicella sp.]|jgi:hypothetical protein
MASKLISALAATALIAAVPSMAVAQNDDGDGIQTEEALGVIFALLAGIILLWEDDGDPISP